MATAAIEIRLASRVVNHMVAAVGGLALLSTVVAAQPLPRVDGALTMEQAVDLAREKSLRVKAADADARTMDSMRREAWPRCTISANRYFNDQRWRPTSSPPRATMARNHQVFRRRRRTPM
jgi:hypothetical protein